MRRVDGSYHWLKLYIAFATSLEFSGNGGWSLEEVGDVRHVSVAKRADDGLAIRSNPY